MLWLVDTAEAAPKVIYVQQAAGGTPEWIKILISGAAGTIFGILSGILLEFLKPLLLERRIKAQALEQISSEIMGDLDLLKSHWKYLSSDDEFSPKDDVLGISVRTLSVLSMLDRDRYKYFFEEHKSSLYALDAQKRLATFYKSLDMLQTFADHKQSMGIYSATQGAIMSGEQFLEDKGIIYEQKETIIDKMDELSKKGVPNKSNNPTAGKLD